jgi:hypothetical protein
LHPSSPALCVTSCATIICADGAPPFLKSNGAVTEPEALLFHDDLTLQIGGIREASAIGA